MATLASALRLPRRTPVGRRSFSAAFYEQNERRRVLWLTIVAVLAAIGLGNLVLNIGVAAVAVPASAAALAAVVWKPKTGLYTLLALALLFEMIPTDPLMVPGRYFNVGLQGTLGLSGVIVSPLELLLIFTASVWLVKGLVVRRLDYRGGDLGWPTALFFLALVGGLIRGAAGAGDMYVAFMEVRPLLYFGAGYLLAANLIRTRRDVGVLVLVFLLANGLYAVEGAFRYVFLIRTDVLNRPPEFYYNHEVVIFLAVVLLQALVQIVVGGPLWRRMLGLGIAPIALFTLFATQRRAGYIAMAIAFVLIAIPWLVRHRKAFLLIFVPGMIAAAIYLPLFWNNTGFLGQPARAVRSLTAPDARDASSNEYRDQEAINVRETIRSDPLLGVGFGRPFLFVVPLADLSWWPFWHYQPHHNVLWVWIKVGAPGFTIFFMLMLGTLALASSRALTLRDPTLITFAYIAIASVVTTLVFCYVDLGLTNNRVTVFLGVVMGVLAVLRRVDEETPEPAAQPADAAKRRASGRASTAAWNGAIGSSDPARPGARPAGRWTPAPSGQPSRPSSPGRPPGSAPPPAEPAPTPAGAGRA